MSKTLDFAKRELEILSKSATDPENRPIIEPFIPEILALVDRFGRSGQSGGSAPYIASALANAVKTLCLQEPLSPVTGIDDEWVDVANITGGKEEVLYQNGRCSALFKDNVGVYYLDAVVWKTPKGGTWSGKAILPSTGEKISSRQYVKKFPFSPKTFIVDVIEKEIAKDDWEFCIKDETQLEEVFCHYHPKHLERQVRIEKTI